MVTHVLIILIKSIKAREAKSMKKEKRFYWLKLSENIFDEHPIVFNLPGGNDAFRLYIELCLKAINSNGVLIFSKKISIFSSLSALTKMDEKIVKQSLKLLIKFDLIIKKEAFILEIKNFSNMIGSVSKDAIRKRKQREKRKNKDTSLLNEKSMVDNVPLLKDNVRDVSQVCPAICPTDLERGKENIRDKEIETRDRYNGSVKTLPIVEVKTSTEKELNNKYISENDFGCFEDLKKIGIIDFNDCRNQKSLCVVYKNIAEEFGSQFVKVINSEVIKKYKRKSMNVSYCAYFKQFYTRFKKNPDKYEFYINFQKRIDEIIKIAQTPWVDNDDED